jgi:hypothetical protein
VRRGLQAQGLLALCQLATLQQGIQVALDRLPRGFQGLGRTVDQAHLQACVEQGRGDACAHGSGAHHGSVLQRGGMAVCRCKICAQRLHGLRGVGAGAVGLRGGERRDRLAAFTGQGGQHQFIADLQREDVGIDDAGGQAWALGQLGHRHGGGPRRTAHRHEGIDRGPA